MCAPADPLTAPPPKPPGLDDKLDVSSLTILLEMGGSATTTLPPSSAPPQLSPGVLGGEQASPALPALRV